MKNFNILFEKQLIILEAPSLEKVEKQFCHPTIIKEKKEGIKNFFFTYGSSESFPFCRGFSLVMANTLTQAILLFRAVHPDNYKGVLNCAFYYNEKEFDYKNFKCHEIISLNISK